MASNANNDRQVAQKIPVHSCTVSHTLCDLNRLIELYRRIHLTCAHPFRSGGRQLRCAEQEEKKRCYAKCTSRQRLLPQCASAQLRWRLTVVEAAVVVAMVAVSVVAVALQAPPMVLGAVVDWRGAAGMVAVRAP